MGATALTVRARGDHVVTITSPGSPPQELVGVRGRKFAIKNRTGYSVEFIEDKVGAITQIAFYQPNGNFVAKRK